MDQRDNIVGGHIAGRDVNITQTGQQSETFMRRLREKFEEECKNNVTFSEIIAALQYYQEPIDEQPIGLEKKLQLGHRQGEIPEALRAKELFAKCLARHSLSESAQQVIAYCLGQINLLFKARIVPLINKGAPRDQVDAALIDQVIQPVFGQLEVNFLHLMPQELKGMVYYLTAHCFLQWHANNAHLPPSA